MMIRRYEILRTRRHHGDTYRGGEADELMPQDCRCVLRMVMAGRLQVINRHCWHFIFAEAVTNMSESSDKMSFGAGIADG